MSDILLSDKEDFLLEDTDGGDFTEVLTVPDTLADERLDRVLSELTGLTRSAAVRLVESGLVTILSGGRTVAPDKKTRMRAGDELTVTHPTAPAPITASSQMEM